MRFNLPLPPSVNHMYFSGASRGVRIKTRRYVDWTKESVLICKEQKYKTLTGEIDLSIGIYFGRRGRNDIDGRLKALLDVLTVAGVYEDDSQVYSMLVNKYYDKDNPRVEVDVREN